MNKAVFLMTHRHSGFDILTSMLEENPRVQCYQTNFIYDYPLQIESLVNRPHKCSHAGAVYLDVLTMNHSVSTKEILENSRVIYLLRPPRETINLLIGQEKMTPLQATRHFHFRIRRICEVCKLTPGAPVLMWDDIVNGKGLKLIENCLFLDEPLRHDPERFAEPSGQNLAGPLLEESEKRFEWYLYYLKNQNLQFVS